MLSYNNNNNHLHYDDDDDDSFGLINVRTNIKYFLLVNEISFHETVITSK